MNLLGFQTVWPIPTVQDVGIFLFFVDIMGSWGLIILKDSKKWSKTPIGN
jgi:hypothetical protein